jgi:type II secretory pathway predicted ATPase ExeA
MARPSSAAEKGARLLRLRGVTGSGVTVMAALLAASLSSMAQSPSQPIVQSARDRALADLTGNWVAQITEDWRWRMITPPKGDYTSLPLNAAGRAAAE